MSCWDILGISPTEDEKQIKKAYAALLRKHNPEDDASGYQQLREAFDSALKIAKQMRKASNFTGQSNSSEAAEDNLLKDIFIKMSFKANAVREDAPPQDEMPLQDKPGNPPSQTVEKPKKQDGYYTNRPGNDIPLSEDKPLPDQSGFYFNDEKTPPVSDEEFKKPDGYYTNRSGNDIPLSEDEPLPNQSGFYFNGEKAAPPPFSDEETKKPDGYYTNRPGNDIPLSEDEPLPNQSGFYFNDEKTPPVSDEEDPNRKSDKLSDTEFMQAVDLLYQDYRLRINNTAWQGLLKRMDADANTAVFFELLKYLTYHYYLPNMIYVTLNDFFHWTLNSSAIISTLSPYYYNFIVHMVKTPDILHYDSNISFNSYKESERYFSERAKALTAMQGEDFDAALTHIETALSVNSSDRDLLIIARECYRKCRNTEQALKFNTRLIDLYPSNNDYYYYSASLLYDSGNYSHALEYCRSLLASDTDNFRALCLAGKCTEKLGLDEADKYFIHARSLDKSDMEPLICYARVYNRLQHELLNTLGDSYQKQRTELATAAKSFNLPAKRKSRLTASYVFCAILILFSVGSILTGREIIYINYGILGFLFYKLPRIVKRQSKISKGIF